MIQKGARNIGMALYTLLNLHSGNGDGFYSSAFQSQLEGNSLYNASMPLGENVIFAPLLFSVFLIILLSYYYTFHLFYNPFLL